MKPCRFSPGSLRGNTHVGFLGNDPHHFWIWPSILGSSSGEKIGLGCPLGCSVMLAWRRDNAISIVTLSFFSSSQSAWFRRALQPYARGLGFSQWSVVIASSLSCEGDQEWLMLPSWWYNFFFEFWESLYIVISPLSDTCFTNISSQYTPVFHFLYLTKRCFKFWWKSVSIFLLWFMFCFIFVFLILSKKSLSKPRS